MPSRRQGPSQLLGLLTESSPPLLAEPTQRVSPEGLTKMTHTRRKVFREASAGMMIGGAGIGPVIITSSAHELHGKRGHQ
jgi:hypothetical protein